MIGKNRFVLSLVLCLFLCIHGAYAGTINAASCSSANVQTAINSASTGDTVLVPAGNCTWSTPVNITNKGITLQGAGINATNITDSTSSAALDVNGASSTNSVKVTALTFISQTNKSGGMLQVGGTLFATNAFRFHHLRLVIASGTTRGIETGQVYGLIDHVTFDVTNGGSVQSISVGGSPDGTDGGFTPWMQPLTFGTVNAVYIEDNTFNYGSAPEDAIDAYGGARFVIRHNVFNGAHIGFHGFDSGNRRSMFSVEVYSNSFINNSGGHYRAGTMRGGTGVWFNNSYTGNSPWDGITLMAYRACGLDQSGWGACNGTNWQLGSTDFSSNASRTSSTNGGVKFCSAKRDNVCTSDTACTAIGGGTCSTFVDGAGTAGYACRDQVGRTHDQALAPVYAWNNGSITLGTYSGGGACNGGGLSNYLLAGRDYIDNTVKPGYVAFAYPHPLQSGETGPEPPAGLSAVVH